jgi:hypothetical protein
MLELIAAFFNDLDSKIEFLKELSSSWHRDEARILCSCYIDWLASGLYWPDERNNFNFVRVLKEYGGDDIFSHIHLKMLERAISRLGTNPNDKKPIRKWEDIYKKIVPMLKQAPKRLYNEQEIITLLSPSVTPKELDDLRKNFWRGTFAAIIYSNGRIPSVHGLGPVTISFDKTTFRDQPVPPIDFSMLHTCVKHIAVAARERSITAGKLFGHDFEVESGK